MQARTRLNPKEIEVILYHYNCTDGLMAAAVGVMYAKQNNKEVETWGLDHVRDKQSENLTEDVIKLIKDKNVLIVDYCPSKKHLMLMIALAKNLIVLDHHKTAFEENKDMSVCYFDMEHSGAGLSWLYYYDSPMPNPVRYVQDRDLWTWKIPESKPFCASFYPKARTISSCLEVLMSADKDIHIDKHIRQGKALIDHIDETLAYAAKRSGRELTLSNNDKLVIINATEYISDLGDKMSASYDYVVMFIMDVDKESNSWQYRISIRSRNGKDCTIIAKLINPKGGGHPGAAGALWRGSIQELEKKLLESKL